MQQQNKLYLITKEEKYKHDKKDCLTLSKRRRSQNWSLQNKIQFNMHKPWIVFWFMLWCLQTKNWGCSWIEQKISCKPKQSWHFNSDCWKCHQLWQSKFGYAKRTSLKLQMHVRICNFLHISEDVIIDYANHKKEQQKLTTTILLF